MGNKKAQLVALIVFAAKANVILGQLIEGMYQL